MYVIVDLHYITDVAADDQFDTTAKQFWADMAPRYADDPKVLYEIFNEPINTGGDQSWSNWLPLAQSYVDIVRAAAPNNLILVGAPRWSQIVGQCGESPITGSNIVYVGHIYGWHYDGADGPAFNTAVASCAASRPMFFTEWGADTQSNAHASTIKTLIKDNGISFTAWAFHNQWGPSLFSDGSDDDPSSWTITPYGTSVKEFLDTY